MNTNAQINSESPTCNNTMLAEVCSPHKFKIFIGDYSNDGHGKSDVFVFDSNKSVSEVQDAYKESCKLTGLQFNHNENYSGLSEHNKYGTDRHIVTEHQTWDFSDLSIEILKNHEINVDNESIDVDVFVDILMKFIKLSIPDLVLKEGFYSRSGLSDIPSVNDFGSIMDIQFGYGLYS